LKALEGEKRETIEHREDRDTGEGDVRKFTIQRKGRRGRKKRK